MTTASKTRGVDAKVSASIAALKDTITSHKFLDTLEAPSFYASVLAKLPWGAKGRLGFFVPGTRPDDPLWIELPIDEVNPGLLLMLCTPQGLEDEWSLETTDGSRERGARLKGVSADPSASTVIVPPQIAGRSGIQIHPFFNASDWQGYEDGVTPEYPKLRSIPVTTTRPDGAEPSSKGCAAIARSSTLKLTPGGVNDPYAIKYLPQYNTKTAKAPGDYFWRLSTYKGRCILEKAIAFFEQMEG